MPTPPSARQPRHLAPLHGVQHTLYLPMLVRAQAAMLCPWLDPQDQRAQRMLARSGESMSDHPTDAATVLNILWRTHKIRELGQDFFERFAHVQGINLGAGLADYFQWLDNGQNRWLDVDLPEVVRLRHQLMPEETDARHEVRAADLRLPGWWSRLGLQRHDHHNPLLLIAEGLLMYMQPTEVKAFMEEIGSHAPEGTELLCDFISPLGIGQASPANRQPGDAVTFTWGAHNGQEIASLHPRLELLDQHSVAEAWGWGGSWLEALCSPLTGGPMYGLAHLKVSDDL